MSEPKTLNQFSEKQIKFIEFLARGKTTKSGEKRSMGEFAQAIGVHQTTLSDWQHIPGFAQVLFEKTLAHNAKHIPTLIAAQMQTGIKGKGGNTQAFMALMRQFELLKSDKIDHTTNGKDMPTPILGGS